MKCRVFKIGHSQMTDLVLHPYKNLDEIIAVFWLHLHSEDEKNWDDFKHELTDTIRGIEPDLKKYDYEFDFHVKFDLIRYENKDGRLACVIVRGYEK